MSSRAQASSKAATSSRTPSPRATPAPATASSSTSTATTTTTTAGAVAYPALYMVFWNSVQQFSNADAGKYHLGFVYVASEPPKTGGSDATYLHITYDDSTETTSGKKWNFKREPNRKRKSNNMRAACYLGTLSANVDLNMLEAKLRTGIVLQQNQTNYRCRHWTLDALQLLITSRYISTPAKTPNELYTTLLAKLEEAIKKNPNAFVTINQKGEVMKKSGLFKD